MQNNHKMQEIQEMKKNQEMPETLETLETKEPQKNQEDSHKQDAIAAGWTLFFLLAAAAVVFCYGFMKIVCTGTGVGVSTGDAAASTQTAINLLLVKYAISAIGCIYLICVTEIVLYHEKSYEIGCKKKCGINLERLFLFTYPIGALMLSLYMPASHAPYRRIIGFVLAYFVFYEMIKWAGEKKEFFFVLAWLTSVMDLVTSGKLEGMLLMLTLGFLLLIWNGNDLSKNQPNKRKKKLQIAVTLLIGLATAAYLFRSVKESHFIENIFMMVGHTIYQQFDAGLLSIAGTYLADGEVAISQYLSIVLLLLLFFAAIPRKEEQRKSETETKTESAAGELKTKKTVNEIEIEKDTVNHRENVILVVLGLLFVIACFLESFGNMTEAGIAAGIHGTLLIPAVVAFVLAWTKKMPFCVEKDAWYKGICMATIWCQVLVVTALAVM